MRNSIAALLVLFTINNSLAFKPSNREYLKITVYHFTTKAQEDKIDRYLRDALVPALHKLKFKKVGVFKLIDNDTLADKRIYVLTHYTSLEQLLQISTALDNNPIYTLAGKEYINSVYNDPPYKRMENIVLYAFSSRPEFKVPVLKGSFADRVYELRSYESPTEKLHKNKVQMFNEGETDIFDKLNFNPVFYGSVIAGSTMPNLMYLTAFENKVDREQHWQAFKNDSAWRKLLTNEFFKKNISKTEIMFLRPVIYSDY